MKTDLTKQDLIAFEEMIKQDFLEGKIKAPIHLSGGNEDQLLEIFQDVKPVDWVFTTYRNHYHALLKGVHPEKLRADILAGFSMYYCNAEYKILSSAIVSGMLPIAVGTAAALKRIKDANPALSSADWWDYPTRVWCFVGDMAAETGMFLECTKYAGRHQLPITFVIEDNGLSTNTPTQEVWGTYKHPFSGSLRARHWMAAADYGADVRYYLYERTVPHVGAGEWVVFS